MSSRVVRSTKRDVRVGDAAPPVIALRVVEGWHEHLVVDVLTRVRRDIVLDQRRRLALVSSDEALVVAPGRPHDRLVRHEDGHDLEVRHVLREDHEADGQRRRQREPDRTPDPGPEGDRYQEPHLGHAGALAVEVRLQDEVGEELQRDEQRHDQDRLEPSVEHRETGEERR